MNWILTFTYTQGKTVYYQDKSFSADSYELAKKEAFEYIRNQNAGEPSSDRIKFKKLVKANQP